MNTSDATPSNKTPKTDAPTKPFRAGWWWRFVEKREDGESDEALRARMRGVFPQVERFIVNKSGLGAIGFFPAEVDNETATTLMKNPDAVAGGNLALVFVPVEGSFTQMIQNDESNAKNPGAMLHAVAMKMRGEHGASIPSLFDGMPPHLRELLKNL